VNPSKRIDAWTEPSRARLLCVATLAVGAGLGLSLAGGELARRYDAPATARPAPLGSAQQPLDTVDRHKTLSDTLPRSPSPGSHTKRPLLAPR